MKQRIVTVVFAFLACCFVKAESFGYVGMYHAATTSSLKKESAAKWYILANYGTYSVAFQELRRCGLKFSGKGVPGLTVGYLKQRFGVYGQVNARLSYYPGSELGSAALGVLYGIGEKKTSVAQLGFGYCDYYRSYDMPYPPQQQSNFFMDLGFIQSFGRLSINVGCGLGEYIVQPRVGVGINFGGRK